MELGELTHPQAQSCQLPRTKNCEDPQDQWAASSRGDSERERNQKDGKRGSRKLLTNTSLAESLFSGLTTSIFLIKSFAASLIDRNRESGK